jgi:hypothetical protein
MRTIHVDRVCKILDEEFEGCPIRSCASCVKAVKKKYKRFFVTTRNHDTIALVSTRGKNLVDSHYRYMICNPDSYEIKTSGKIANNPHKKYSGDVVRFKIVLTYEEENLGDLNL